MTFTELAAARRSTRRFEVREIAEETVNRILGTTFSAPSSRNCRSTRIAVTRDPRIMEIVGDMRVYGSDFVRNAPLAFFIMADPAESDLWRENCAISATMLQFAAQEQGLASCWVHVEGRLRDADEPSKGHAIDYLREHIPAIGGLSVLCVVAAGYPDESKRPHSLSLPEDKVIYLDRP